MVKYYQSLYWSMKRCHRVNWRSRRTTLFIILGVLSSLTTLTLFDLFIRNSYPLNPSVRVQINWFDTARGARPIHIVRLIFSPNHPPWTSMDPTPSSVLRMVWQLNLNGYWERVRGWRTLDVVMYDTFLVYRS